MIDVGSVVRIGRSKHNFEVMSINECPENSDYDIFWLKWGDNEDCQELKGIALYTGNFRKELTEIVV
jgi:hypothetical protein